MGTNWKELKACDGCNVLKCFSISEDITLVQSYDGSFKTSDDGEHWIEFPLPELTCLEKNKNNIFGGTQSGIYFSSDEGTKWTKLNNGLSNMNISCLLSCGDSIIAGTSGNGLFLLTNNGNFWTEFNNPGLKSKNIKCLAKGKKNLFVGSSDKGLFISTNNGDSWNQINNEFLTDTTVINAIVTYEDRIFVATRYGVIASTDDGDTWINDNSGMKFSKKKYFPLNYIVCLAIFSGRIFAGTGLGGVFSASLSDFGITSVEEKTNIFDFDVKLSPNPATDFIEISVPVRAQHAVPLQIRIYNIFGQEFNPTPALPKGREFGSPPLGEDLGGVLKIDVSSLPPGLYFVRVGEKVKKFIKI